MKPAHGGREMVQSKLDVYQEVGIGTQNPVKLIVLLYDGAAKFLRVAKLKLAEGDYVGKGHFIARAQAIVAELNAVLNLEEGGEVAVLLRRLYQFMFSHLGEANVERDPRKIDQVIAMLEGLNESWRAVAACDPLEAAAG
jgi:flagellar protein FliS